MGVSPASCVRRADGVPQQESAAAPAACAEQSSWQKLSGHLTKGIKGASDVEDLTPQMWSRAWWEAHPGQHGENPGEPDAHEVKENGTMWVPGRSTGNSLGREDIVILEAGDYSLDQLRKSKENPAEELHSALGHHHARIEGGERWVLPPEVGQANGK